MTGGITIKNLGSWQSTMRRYREVSSRKDPRVILDTKGFYIARGAVRETPKANAGEIGRKLSQQIYEWKDTKSGARRSLKAVTRFDGMGRQVQVPLGALLVNARRGRMGKPGLYGSRMKVAVNNILANRVRSIAFLKSGWLGAIRELEPFAENKSKAPARDGTVKQYGRPKGGGSAASRHTGSAVARTLIMNSASTNHDTKGALEMYGLPAFVRAWNAEIASMEAYIQEKMKARAKEHGFKVN